MPKISMSGASDSLTDPDYIAPPGVSPSDGIVAGLRSTGDEDREEDVKARQDHAKQMAERARENDESGQNGEQGDTVQTQRTEGGQRSTADAGTNDTASSTSARVAGRASTDAGQAKDGKSDSKSGKTTR